MTAFEFAGASTVHSVDIYRSDDNTIGEDENGEYLGDPPTIFVNLCLHCYDWSVNVDDYIPNEPSEIKRVERVGKTFEEIFAEGEKWERDTECAEVFEHSDYKCDSCDEVLIEGAIVQW